MKINLIDGTGGGPDDSINDELTQNWYVHIDPRGKNEISLLPTPGLELFIDFSSVNNGECRGGIKYNDLLYVVVGDKLYETTSAGGFLERGSLNTSSGRVGIAHNGSANGQQIMIADGTNGYIYDSSTVTLSVISDVDYPDTATQVKFMDGYFIVNDPSNTGSFYVSSSYDGTGWVSTDFATAERDPDDLQAIEVSGRLLWLIGKDTAEAWYNSGNTDFPFEPIQSGFSEWGTPAAWSVAEMAGSIFYLAQNTEGPGQVVMTNGMVPQVISDFNIATQITKLTTPEDAYSYVYQENGHSFYVLSFPTDGKTFVYDITTQKWHTRASKTIGYHRSSFHSYVYKKHIVGDPVQGKLYYFSDTTYTDNGDTITRIRRSRSIHAEDRAVRHHALWVDMKEGVGDATTTDPQIMMRFRDDNGAWTAEKWRSIGKIGERKHRIVWRMLGRSRDRVYELKITDPIKAIIIGSYLNISADEKEIR